MSLIDFASLHDADVCKTSSNETQTVVRYMVKNKSKSIVRVVY